MRHAPPAMPRTPVDVRQKLGKYYRPRGAVADTMCASCPFGNEERLARKVEELGCADTSPIINKEDAINAAEAGIEFKCHSTLIHDRESQTTITPPDAKVCKGFLMYKRGEI